MMPSVVCYILRGTFLSRAFANSYEPAHRKIFQISGILHRDISPRNILINPRGDDGDRGIIIDFDNAISVDNCSLYAKESIVVSFFLQAVVIVGFTQLFDPREPIVLCLETFSVKVAIRTWTIWSLSTMFCVGQWP